MTEKGFQNIIFLIIITDCSWLLYLDSHKAPVVVDWVLMLILEFCAQFLFNNLTKKQNGDK